MGSLVSGQAALLIGGIIAVLTAKGLVPLPRGQVGSLVPCQVSLFIGGIIAVLTAKRLVPLPGARWVLWCTVRWLL